METYQAIFGTAHPNWLVGGFAVLGVIWAATWAWRLMVFNFHLSKEISAIRQRERPSPKE
jgi:hypothetical protein